MNLSTESFQSLCVSIFHEASVAFLLLSVEEDRQFRIVSANKKFLDLTQFDIQSLVDQTITVLVPKKYNRRHRLLDAHILEHEGMFEDVACKTQNGEAIVLDSNVRRFVFQDRQFALVVFHDTSEKKKLEEELLHKHFDLRKAYEELEKTYKELHAAQENLKLTQTQLVQVEKMASIGLLAAGAAHEINNPLGILKSNLNTLDSDTDDILELLQSLQKAVDDKSVPFEVSKLAQKIDLDYLIEDLPQILKDAKDASERITGIVNALGKCYTPRWGDPVASHVDTAVKAAIDSIQKQNTNYLKPQCDLHCDNTVEFSPGKLQECLEPIILNGFQAIENKADGVLRIRSSEEEEKVIITIDDNGPGISEKHLSKVLEPFFSTKSVGKGKGLGLFLAYQIISNHKGEMMINSQEGVGCQVIVILHKKIPGGLSISHIAEANLKSRVN